MTTPKDTGGAAFPHKIAMGVVSDGRGNSVAMEGNPHPGMSLRDWFAGQALAGITTAMSVDASTARLIVVQAERERVPLSIQLARICWDYADAMLAERNKP